MISREQVLEALSTLQDAEFNDSLVALNFVRDIMIKEDSVSVSIISSQDNEAYSESLKQQAIQALQAKGVVEVRVRLRAMTEYDRNEVNKRSESSSASNTAQPPLQHPNAPTTTKGLLAPDSKVNFIAIASGKGGVGKSTVTVNLAVALARLGKRVGIMDADIYGFSIPDMMGIEERPDLVNDLIIPVERHGVKVISMGFFVENNAPIIWRGPMLGKMLKNFFNEVSWGELDYLLLDLPPGTGDIALDVHQMIPQSKEIIVTTPHATAAFVAARAGAMAVHTNHEILGVVENMAYYECGKCGEKDYVFGRGGGGKLAEELHSKLLAQIPLGAPDNHPSESDYSPSVYKADSTAGQIYLDMARGLIDRM